MAEIKKGFGPPPEVTGYFDRKGLKPAFSHLDVWATEHAHAFTVAKATELSLVTTFRDSISKAIKAGKGFETWREEIRAELAAQGWAGPRMVSDPAGADPDRMVDFSRSNRLRTIFWGNMSSARAAGQWERAQRTKGAMPFLLYVRTTSADPRPEHLGWVGIILPVDDPFWATHFPPNGWLCHCSVRQVSRREKETLIATKRSDGVYYTDTAPPVVMRDWRNRRTGEISRIPDGIDPGWHGNPGRDRTKTLLDNLELRLGEAPERASTKALTDLWSDPFVALAPKVDGKTWLPAGVSPKLANELGGARSPVVSIEAGDVAARVERHGLDVEDFGVLPEMLRTGTVLPDPRGKASTRSILFKVDKTWWRAFVHRSAKGYLRVTSLHQRDEAAALAELARSGK
ncbi:putative Prophage MuSo2, F protein [uncultured Pleomorphomonas sp.]|uniref:Phage head morphogenesis domain-containing protein n=2 Tax=Pleomorphomonas TaxID=261933 RepID=A0A2G9WV51_9HYPH|nr:phage minor head protein [Pleomorphomonas carboxyditropha]PIO98591.1 hypothetical protein CJ014_14835 [Pleomorphomonas carboxyditropha]SCM75432.1 putative Prophage MuSo2, F protein [uncultured Pleomorphomonas sp.]